MIGIRARTNSRAAAACTGCGAPSDWSHSRYVRHLADAAVGGRPVRIDLSVRRLYCENPACPKVTFAEQVPGLTVRYQRRTPLLQRVVEEVGILLAGRGGARMLQVVDVVLLRSTVLAQLMRMPLPPLVTPRVLGVDDFALYGGAYGTLLVDATTRLPLTLWEGRDAEQLRRWLRGHPGVEVVCRDRSLAYRQGIAAGAPDALQVSDRFHLWQSLSRRVQDVASAHRDCLPAALPEPEQTAPEPDGAAATTTGADTPAGRHARRLFEAVRAATDTGRSHSSVARELGLDRRTVRKYARARTWQEVVRRPPRRPSTLDPYLDYLQQRWDEGEHSATVLHQELLAKGYSGHYQRVKMAVAPLRRGLPLDELRERPPSPRETARWIVTAPHRHTPHTAECLHRLLDHCPELHRTHDLVRQFATMRQPRRHTAAGLARPTHQQRTGASRRGRSSPARGSERGCPGDHHPLQLRRQRRPHHRRETPETHHGGTRRRPLLRHRVVLIAHLRRHYAARPTIAPG